MPSVSIDHFPGDEQLCAVLGGRGPGRRLSEEDFNALWERACAHDVDVLLAAACLRLEDHIPADASRQVAGRLADAELRDLLRCRELCRIAANFAAVGVDVLLLKGAGLAHTVYPAPQLRPSRDIDLFIRRESLDAAERALAACGYTRLREPDTALASTQSHYGRMDGSGVHHFIDLHWCVANPRSFADALSFDEAWRGSIVVPAIEPVARTLGLSDALLLACMHRVAHHQDAPDLLWLWDIHLLAGSLTADGWAAFLRRAERARMRAVSLRGLVMARDRFATCIPADTLERLGANGQAEPAARFIGGDLRIVDVVRADLWATRGLRRRASLLREHLFPPREYMRAVYASCPPALLPIAYVDRIVRGAPGWFRRPAADHDPRQPDRGLMRRAREAVRTRGRQDR